MPKKKQKLTRVDVDKLWAIQKTRHHCSECGQLTLISCDKSKKSELVEWMGQDYRKTKPQKMWMYPSTGRVCPYCGAKYSLDGVLVKEIKKIKKSIKLSLGLPSGIKRTATNKIKRVIFNLSKM